MCKTIQNTVERAMRGAPIPRDPRHLLQSLLDDLQHPDYAAPSTDYGSAREFEAIKEHVEAVLWRVNDWANDIYAHVAANSHGKRSSKFDAGISDIGMQELGGVLDDAIEAAHEHADQVAYDARFAARQAVLDAAE